MPNSCPNAGNDSGIITCKKKSNLSVLQNRGESRVNDTGVACGKYACHCCPFSRHRILFFYLSKFKDSLPFVIYFVEFAILTGVK